MSTITSYSEVSPTRRSLDLEIPADVVQKETEKTARELARQLRIPGFRPGKIPIDLVKRRFAADIRSQVLEHLIKHAISDAFVEKNLNPIGEPKIEDVKFGEDAPLTFRLEIEIRPDVVPKDYRGLKVPTEPTAATEEEIEKALDDMRQGHATFDPVEDRPAMDGDFALIDIDGNFPQGDGEDFHHDKVLVEIGGEKTMPEISAHLRNAEAGARMTFQKDFDADPQNGEYAGKVVLYTVALNAIKKKVLPDLDDELARQILTPRDGEAPEGADVPMLRNRIKTVIGMEKDRALRQKKERALLDGLLALNHVEPPESMVQSQIDGSVRDYARALAKQGVDLKQADISWQRLREEARPSSERRVKEYLLLDAIGEIEKIEVTNTELDAAIQHQARVAGSTPAELKASLKKAERLEGLREELRIQKVIEFLLAEAITPSAS